MRSAPAGESMYDVATFGRESFESANDDDDDAPVKVLSRAFDVAATMAAPPGAVGARRSSEDESLGVFCRLRPLARGETGGLLKVLPGDKTVRGEVRSTGFKQYATKAKDFSFSHVFKSEASQAEVYERTTAPLVDALFRGRSSLLFTYGVTNAGKSYTMMGESSEERGGILPRALGAILERARATKDCVVLSFIEIYNENVYDLMDKAGGPAAWGNHHHAKTGGRRALRLKDLGNRVEVNNLSSVRVSTIAQGLALAKAAEAQRKTASTGLNATSSRSHSICQLELRPANEQPHHHRRPVSSTLLMQQQRPPKAQLMLVDLAGSERVDRTGASGHQQKEANHINQSISRLMHCLRVLREKQSSSSSSSLTNQAVVPWRESKLTHLFQYLLCPPPTSGHNPLFPGQTTTKGATAAKVSMIVNVSPSVEDHSESLFVMANAASAKAVTIKQHANASSTDHHRATTTTQQYDNNGRRVTHKRPAEKPVDALRRDTFEEKGRGSSTTTSTSNCAEKEIESLRAALAAARDRVGEVEREVRKECAEEMTRTIGQIQKDYERRMRARSTTFGAGARAAAQQRLSEEENGEDPAKRRRNNDSFADRLHRSARKQQTRADLEEYIADLEDKFEETEAELERVRAESARQIRELKAKMSPDEYAQIDDDDDRVDEGPALLEPVDEDRSSSEDYEEGRRRTTVERGAEERDGEVVRRELRAELAQLRTEMDRVEETKRALEESVQSHAETIRRLQSQVSALEAQKAALVELKDQAIGQVVELRAQLSATKTEKKQRQLIYDEQQPPPPPPPRRTSRSPLKENSPIVSTHRSVKDAAQSFDARARKLKDERLARQRATQKKTASPVAARTRGYKQSK